MKFGLVPVRDAVDGVVAHTLRKGDLVLKKGTVVTPDHVAALLQAGIDAIVVALAEPGDLGENAAAEKLMQALAGPGTVIEAPQTGRSNLFSAHGGLLMIDGAAVDAANAVDEAVTIATLPPMRKVVDGEMVATVKIIPFAVDEAKVARAAALARSAIRVVPFKSLRVTVISTVLPGLKHSVVDKTLAVLNERIRGLAASEAAIDVRVAHAIAPLTQALTAAVAAKADLVIVFGASAITDRRDVIPAALEMAGGRIEHLGMPVDPGNLLLLGELGGATVIGAPGCARSPRENGFDWVLQRVFAGLTVTRSDIQRMGIGGLLMEIVSRPQPRSASEHAAGPVTAVIVLAAGRSSRMGSNKLLEPLGGTPVVRHVVEAALASPLSPVLVVTGHQAEEVRAALSGLDVRFVHNPRHAEGMASSLQAGLAEVPQESAAAMVMLGDMPLVTPAVLSRLAGSLAEHPAALAVVPVADDRRGNPVIVARALFGEIAKLEGDVGARAVLEAAGSAVVEVMVPGDAVLTDVDTPDALELARRTFAG